MEIEFDGIKYKEGDKIEFVAGVLNATIIGTLKFGIYNDDEMCRTLEHLGFYVEFKWPSDNSFGIYTLPDIIRINDGKLQ